MHRAGVLGRARHARHHRDERHAALGARAGTITHDLGVHGTGVLRAGRPSRGGCRLSGIFRRVGLELDRALLAAEVIRAAAVLDLGGRVRGLDLHAAHRIDRGLHIFLRLGLEPRRAMLAAEVIRLAAMRDGRARLGRIDSHTAHRVSRHDAMMRRPIAGRSSAATLCRAGPCPPGPFVKRSTKNKAITARRIQPKIFAQRGVSPTRPRGLYTASTVATSNTTPRRASQGLP